MFTPLIHYAMSHIKHHISLLPYNTFRIDVCAKLFAEYTSIDELRQLLNEYKHEKILHIGAGSNLVFTRDFDGLVLHSAMRRAKALDEDNEHLLIEAENGLVLDELIAQLCDMGLSGMENLSYIPGEVGASAVQNVGAYGVEAKDLIVQVKAIEILTGNERIFSNQECNYAYRDSIFKNELKGKYIITSVIYRLDKHLNPKLEYGGLAREVGGNVNLNAIRKAIIRIRKQKLPEVSALGSAGSFFKNPIVTCEQYNALLARYATIPHYEQDGGVKIPAAWLIEQCGWKGKMCGGAQCYEKQPLVLVNANQATPEDIINLAEAIAKDVLLNFGITILPEVNYI